MSVQDLGASSKPNLGFQTTFLHDGLRFQNTESGVYPKEESQCSINHQDETLLLRVLS